MTKNHLVRAPMSIPRLAVAVLLFGVLSGCATPPEERRVEQLLAAGDVDAALPMLSQLARSDPTGYRLRYLQVRDDHLRDLLQKARQDATEEAYRAVLRLDPRNEIALAGLAALERDAQRVSQGVELERNRSLVAEPMLSDALRKPVTLELRDASIQMVLEILSRTSDINFILDKDVKADTRTTIFARNTSVEEALNLVLRTSQLSRKVLNESTLLIYADSEEKKRHYEDLVMRTFYLKNADPKKMQEMVRTLIGPKSMYVDDRLKMMVVRDNLDVIAAVERLVASYDVADPEVLLEVEILEVNANGLLNAGIQYPDRLAASVHGRNGQAGRLTVDELRNLDRNGFELFLPDPLLALNLKQTRSDAKTLANPRIRVTNRQKAKVLIGDKVPVITTTTNQASSASMESINYLDVGLKLEVVPEIHVNGEVTMAVELEVSNVAKEIRSTTGLLAYQIGTRNASTVLRLRDGETQALAGLLKDEQNDNAAGIPGLGALPGVGRLFSNRTHTTGRSEIVLLITPRIVRAMPVPSAHVIEFPSGTVDSPSVRPLRLAPVARQGSADAQGDPPLPAKVQP